MRIVRLSCKCASFIHERFPDHGILGEEFESEQLDASGRWILDPVDGTRAFIAGLPTWGTLIGYFHEDGHHTGHDEPAFHRGNVLWATARPAFSPVRVAIGH